MERQLWSLMHSFYSFLSPPLAQIVVLGGPDKGKTGKLIGLDGDTKGGL